MNGTVSIYDLVGEAGFTRLVAAFYARVPQDDVLGPMYPPENLVEAQRRLREFLIFRFGGPDRYIQERGHPRLGMRHVPFAIDQVARDRWMSLMEQALKESRIPDAAAEVLRKFFDESATFLINRPR